MKSQTYVGELEQMVLWSVIRLQGQGYGAKVIQDLEERIGRRVSPGALYATLDRLEGKGLIESTIADPDPVRGGRRKRYLAVTEPGRTALRRTRAEWMSMWDGIDPAAEGR